MVSQLSDGFSIFLPPKSLVCTVGIKSLSRSLRTSSYCKIILCGIFQTTLALSENEEVCGRLFNIHAVSPKQDTLCKDNWVLRVVTAIWDKFGSVGSKLNSSWVLWYSHPDPQCWAMVGALTGEPGLRCSSLEQIYPSWASLMGSHSTEGQ